MYALKQVRLIPLVLVVVMFAGGASALADPYFEIWSSSDWNTALDANDVIPMTSGQWNNYMAEWASYKKQGSYYPSTTFLVATLYAYNGAGVPYDPDPNTAGGMVMAWGDGTLSTGSYASAWMYDYPADPDLTNAIITLTVFPPQFSLNDPNNAITQISFGVQDSSGRTRSWYWDVGPGKTIPWDANTSVTIYPSQWGLNATIPPADGFMSNPAFDITAVQSFIADENGAIVGGQVPIPPGGQSAAMWNYWNDIVVVGPGYPQKDYLIEFSLDIGSDHELSDPRMDGDEAFDPGDVYWWQSAPVIPPGRDGFKDDQTIFFGTDPYPNPPDPNVPPATRVPVGDPNNPGDPNDYDDYFDLDGHDQLDFSLQSVEFPVSWTPSQCVYDPNYLLMSLEDDKPDGWPVGDVPVTVFSTAGAIYGTVLGRNEIIVFTPGVGIAAFADEMTVHQSLLFDPGGNPEDDDVDSLDIVEDANCCTFWFFSADHEANRGLNPGGIYEVTGGTPPAQVINEALLGISGDTDIDAFEFAWWHDPNTPGWTVLVLLYSVDEDDSLTPVDESGGMNPRAIYYSTMTGTSWLFSSPWWWSDDVDALAVWYEEP